MNMQLTERVVMIGLLSVGFIVCVLAGCSVCPRPFVRPSVSVHAID